MKLVRFHSGGKTFDILKLTGRMNYEKLDAALKGLNVEYEVITLKDDLAEGTIDELTSLINSSYKFNNHHKVG